MLRRTVLSLVCLFACGSQPASTSQESAGKAAPVDKVQREDKAAAMFATITDSLAESREIAAAYAEGKLGDRLAADKIVLIDGKAPKGTDQAQYYVLPAGYSGPTSTAADLHQAARADRKQVKRAMLGGEDGDRVGLVRGVEPGKYIACAALGPLSSPSKEAYLKRSKELLGEGGLAKTDSKKLAAAAKQAQAETGYTPEKRDWTQVVARCKPIEVTDDVASRVVVIDPASP